jgi:DedD protein
MAFFKSRSQSTASAEERNADNGEAQSMDMLRQRARHRLIGATVLVLIAVIGFPLVFDTKPREVASDIRIDMPERDAVRSSQVPATPVVEAKAPVPDDVKAPASQAPEPEPKDIAKLPEVPVAEVKKPEAKPAESKVAEVKAASKEVVVNTTKPEEDPAKTDDAPRFIVQVGAFSDEAKVKEVRAKLEKAGFKTYVHVAQTKNGKRTRVRIGPFASKEEAQKTVNKIKPLQLSAAVLTL